MFYYDWHNLSLMTGNSVLRDPKSAAKRTPRIRCNVILLYNVDSSLLTPYLRAIKRKKLQLSLSSLTALARCSQNIFSLVKSNGNPPMTQKILNIKPPHPSNVSDLEGK